MEAVIPLRIESSPSEGPTVRSSRYVRPAGRAPARSTSARSLASSGVKLPVICPVSVIRSWIRGADCTRLSRMIARNLPTLAPVAAENFSAPAAVRKNVTELEPNWPRDGRAFFKSRPVMTAVFFTRYRLGLLFDQLRLRRDRAIRSQRVLVGRGSLLDQLQLQERRALDQVLDPLGVVDAGQLNQDPVRSLAGDQGLGDAELVHPVADRLDRLRHRVVLRLAAARILQGEAPFATG